ncbi:hypothetical protein APHAL10511_001479 [Amanita phalloides]|nr:hypothetical protein APHAL10511_001479 [Amanita phalloides]
MPPKLSKRQQRELEELEALKANQLHDGSSDEDDLTYSISRPTKVTTFSQLVAADGESEPESEPGAEAVGTNKSGKSRKQRKRKKKIAAAETPSESSHATISIETSKMHQVSANQNVSASGMSATKFEKKALKKAKAKEKKSGMNELDQALAELAIRSLESHQIFMTAADSQSLAQLLAVSLSHLDSEAELRKFFGSKVIQAAKTSSGSTSQVRHQGAAGALRSNLTKPKPTWWSARQREGLSIRAYTDEEAQEKPQRQVVREEKWWTVEYSKKYKSMTKAFMATVMSGDPQGFWNLLGKLPWHADTLLQIAEIYRHREEWAQAVDFVDRALFTYERSFIGAFNFTNGQNRLDFDRVENRPFFLAIHRQISDLQRRGCMRAAFEFAKLLYSLDPWLDPHGSLFHLDLLALKAPGMHQWLLDVYDLFLSRRRSRSQEKRDIRMDPSLLPGWAYSRALALWILEEARKDTGHIASSEALKEAILSFPSVVLPLADRIDVTIPDNVRAHKDFKIEVDGNYLSLANAILHMLSHLYAQHAFGIWKEPAHSAWFTSVVMSLSSTIPSTLPRTLHRDDFLHLYEHSANLRYSAYRHVAVLESSYRRLFVFMPKEVTDSRSLACDPLPPLTATTRYDAEFFEGIDDAFGMPGTRTRRQREADQRRLAHVMQDQALMQQLQEIVDGNPELAARFPGGALQLAQFAGQLPADALEDMFLQIQMGVEQHDRMPGEFDDAGTEVGVGQAEHHEVEDHGREQREEENSEDDSEEDEDEDEEASSAIVRGLRNIVGRFWGRSRPDDSTSEDEILPMDVQGVD